MTIHQPEPEEKLDIRCRVSGRIHKIMFKLAEMSGLPLSTYLEDLVVAHVEEKMAAAKNLLAADTIAIDPAQPVFERQLIYFIQRGNPSGPIKIGITKNLKKRLKALRTGSEEQLFVLHSCDAHARGFTERGLHRKFRHLQMEGEWFKPEADLLAFIEKIKSTFPVVPPEELPSEFVE